MTRKPDELTQTIIDSVEHGLNVCGYAVTKPSPREFHVHVPRARGSASRDFIVKITEMQ